MHTQIEALTKHFLLLFKYVVLFARTMTEKFSWVDVERTCRIDI